MSAERLMRHTTVLASDEFEGRGPGTRGEQLTVEYLIREMKALGLEPGNPDGTFVQRVPLHRLISSAEARFVGANGTAAVGDAELYVTVEMPITNVEIAGAPVVFAGYGIVAPEYVRDDYGGVDAKGKVVAVLRGLPPGPAPPRVAAPSDVWQQFVTSAES